MITLSAIFSFRFKYLDLIVKVNSTPPPCEKEKTKKKKKKKKKWAPIFYPWHQTKLNIKGLKGQFLIRRSRIHLNFAHRDFTTSTRL